ncbi:hypothetical protein [Dehalococcoides mccartyi]|uniref:hypothetical protein n=1 Tax=Dehalococcoides mccartyi TaxID=61435 RepID=UPI0003C806A4|nr:hypothetical protein [Dehalococcoides mccartyi]AHB13916.1 hypothetical protein GY50_1145 [Dehalococcoides mccartyi GY50]
MSKIDNRLFYASEIYSEELRFRVMEIMAIIESAVGVVIISLLGYLAINPPTPADEVPYWLVIFMALVMLGVTLLVYNMRKMFISLSTEGIYIRFGYFKRFFPWLDVESAEINGRNRDFYGGYGVRMTWDKKGRILVCITPKTPTVSINLVNSKYRKLVISTNRPDEVLLIASKHAGKNYGSF